MKRISLLGSTGSIGVNVTNIVRQFPSRYKIVSLAAGRNIELLEQQIREFTPEVVSVANEQSAIELQRRLPSYNNRIFFGSEGNEIVAKCESANFVVSAIVGAAGLLPTLAAVRAGKDIGLANKESLVMAGNLVMKSARKSGVSLLPIDSEHSAIFQALEAGRREDLDKIILTASGGPFVNKTLDELQVVTPDQALNHPNWSMGRKVSIDSSTLMNKGLEVIEAYWLFGVDIDSIDVVVHPQSIVHSLVEFRDGSVVAQLGIPDMRIPIAYALSYPERLPLKLDSLNLSQCSNLEFIAPDYERFPCLSLAFRAIEEGGVVPAVMNAANEIAVNSFLNHKINYYDIPKLIRKTMDEITAGSDESLDDILEADSLARSKALSLI